MVNGLTDAQLERLTSSAEKARFESPSDVQIREVPVEADVLLELVERYNYVDDLQAEAEVWRAESMYLAEEKASLEAEVRSLQEAIAGLEGSENVA